MIYIYTSTDYIDPGINIQSILRLALNSVGVFLSVIVEYNATAASAAVRRRISHLLY